MSPTIRLRKIDFTTPAAAASLALQRLHGPSCRAYWLKQALVAAGWTVYYSSTGLASSASDLWTSSSFQAVMLQMTSSVANTTGTVDAIWCCLRSPTADANGDYLHICLSPSQAQWRDPAVRGPTNDLSSSYGVNTQSNAYNGTYRGFLRLGMTLSPSATAFSGGSVFSATSSSTARGDLPVATGAFWTLRNLGNGSSSSGAVISETVVTEGNQFLLIEDNATTAAALSPNRLWGGVCSLESGGYAVVEPSLAPNATAGNYKAFELYGGRMPPFASYGGSDMPTTVGGWRTGYIKRDGGTLISGGLACPEPVGYEAIVDQPYFATNAGFPSTVQLQAISCTDPTHFNLGSFSDFVLMSNRRVNDLDLLRNTSAQNQWYAFKEAKAYLLKWDPLDNPALRTVVIPPNSVV